MTADTTPRHHGAIFQWEKASLARKRLRVRVPLAPPYYKFKEELTVSNLQDEYDYCCLSIEVACQAISLGRNVEYNRQQNQINQEKIAKIKKEAKENGIELLPYRRENNPYN